MLFQSLNHTFPDVIATKILAIWQHLGQFLAIFSPHMCKTFSGQGLHFRDHDDHVYPVNSCFTQMFDRTKILS